MAREVLLHTLSTGDKVIWRPDNQSISISFEGPRKILSTSLFNGGYREDLTGIFNHNCGPDDRGRAKCCAENGSCIFRFAGIVRPKDSSYCEESAIDETVSGIFGMNIVIGRRVSSWKKDKG